MKAEVGSIYDGRYKKMKEQRGLFEHRYINPGFSIRPKSHHSRAGGNDGFNGKYEFIITSAS
jgi:hypothetical protein